jgi:hypothetical protein
MFGLALMPVTFLLVWFGFIWWLAPIVVIVAYSVGTALAHVTGRPRNPLDHFYVDRLERDMVRRHRDYQAAGDALRAQASEDFITRIRSLREGAAESVTVDELEDCRRQAVAAIHQYPQPGQSAEAALALLAAIASGYDFADESKRRDLAIAAAGALVAFDEAPARQRLAATLKPFPDNLRGEVANLLRAQGLVDDSVSDEQAIRVVGETGRTAAFDPMRVQSLLSRG